MIKQYEKNRNEEKEEDLMRQMEKRNKIHSYVCVCIHIVCVRPPP